MKFDSNPQKIGVGDLVALVNLPTADDESERYMLAHVTRVVERFRSNGIEFKLTTGKVHNRIGSNIDFCDVSWAQLIHRSLNAPRVCRNPYYQAEYLRDDYRWATCNTRGTLVGSAGKLAPMMLIDDFYADIPYGICPRKTNLLWEKDNKPGLKHVEQSGRKIYWSHINPKTFSRWVKANVNKIKRTRAQWLKDELINEKQDQEDYRREYEEDFKRDFARDNDFSHEY